MNSLLGLEKESRYTIVVAVAVTLVVHIIIAAALLLAFHLRQMAPAEIIIPLTLIAPRPPLETEREKQEALESPGSGRAAPMMLTPISPPTALGALWWGLCEAIDPQERRRLGLPDCDPLRPPSDAGAVAAIAAAQREALTLRWGRRTRPQVFDAGAANTSLAPNTMGLQNGVPPGRQPIGAGTVLEDDLRYKDALLRAGTGGE